MTAGVRYHLAVRVTWLLVAATAIGCKAKSAAPPTSDRAPAGSEGSANVVGTGEPGGEPGKDLEGGSSVGVVGGTPEPDVKRPIEHGGRPVTDDVGQVIAVGSLDQSLIRREIKKRLGDVNKCYEQAIAIKPALAGAIVAQFTIKPDGKVSGAKSSGVDDELGRCVARVIELITFPRPKNGGNVAVSYPFQFRLAAGSAR